MSFWERVSNQVKGRTRRAAPSRRRAWWQFNAGTTFVELMVATAVFTSGTVALMGGVMSLSTHRQSADDRSRTSSFAGSTFEDLRGSDLPTILAYDVPVDDPQTNTVNIPGIGPVTVRLFAVIPGVNGGVTSFFELGVDDASVINPATFPNPVEIRATMTPVNEGGDGYVQAQYIAAGMIDY